MSKKPCEGFRIQCLTRDNEDGVVYVPQCVHICAARNQKRHHRDPVDLQCRPHQGSIATLVHIRPVHDHPVSNRQPHRSGRLPGYPAYRHPRERPIFAVPNRRSVQFRIARHRDADALNVVVVNRTLQLRDLFARLDLCIQLGPARKAIAACNLNLRIGKRLRLPRSMQMLGLIPQVAKIGAIRQTP